jgi:hypothetical protein
MKVTLGENMVYKMSPPGRLSDREKAAQLGVVRQLLGEARANSQHMPATEVERRIRTILKTVREAR